MFIAHSTEMQYCYYCKSINKVESESDYPLRTGIFSVEGIIYRCAWHAQFQCNKCGNFYHFSWFYWCPNTNELICGSCSTPTLTTVKFWDRTYAYTFHCENCNKIHYDLLYAEYQGYHPWQQDEIETPSTPFKKKEHIVSIIHRSTPWLPIWRPLTVRQGKTISLEDALKIDNNALSIKNALRKVRGSVRFHSDLTPENEISYEASKDFWEKNSDIWIEAYKEKAKDEGDFNRQVIIDPALWEQLGDIKGLRVLDAGCGNGYLSRQLGGKGAEVVGVDHSKGFIEYCINQENQTSLGCKFYQGSLSDLSFLEDESFDLIVSNIVMVDVIDYKEAFKELQRILKPKGRFVWSNLHPVFGRIGQVTYRLPFDTQRNEERLFTLIDRYFDSGGTLISWNNLSPLWQIDRTLTEYSRALKEAGFVIREIVEPKPSIGELQKHPEQLAFDADRFPLFIIYDCVKIDI
ncbi:MAG: class I SAM-dependent methyltransferase [Promethearchaeota archaeon]